MSRILAAILLLSLSAFPVYAGETGSTYDNPPAPVLVNKASRVVHVYKSAPKTELSGTCTKEKLNIHNRINPGCKNFKDDCCPKRK